MWSNRTPTSSTPATPIEAPHSSFHLGGAASPATNRQQAPSDTTTRSPSAQSNLSIDTTFTSASQPPIDVRNAVVLDRFTQNADIQCLVNHNYLNASALGRSFYDFVSPADIPTVRTRIESAKSWGVNESGWPSDGGFVYVSFSMVPRGRDSRWVKRSSNLVFIRKKKKKARF